MLLLDELDVPSAASSSLSCATTTVVVIIKAGKMTRMNERNDERRRGSDNSVIVCLIFKLESTPATVGDAIFYSGLCLWSLVSSL